MPTCLLETCQKYKTMGHWVHPICHINENSPKPQHALFTFIFFSLFLFASNKKIIWKGRDRDTYALKGSCNFPEMVHANFPSNLSHKGKLFFPIISLNHIVFVVVLWPISIVYKLSTALILFVLLWLLQWPLVYPTRGFYLLICVLL